MELKILVLYNSCFEDNIAAAAIVQNRYRDVELIDIDKKNEAQIFLEIAEIPNGSKHEVYVVTNVITPYEFGSITDSHVLLLEDKLIGSGVDINSNDSAVIIPEDNGGVYSNKKLRPLLLWESLYPELKVPLAIHVLSNYKFVDYKDFGNVHLSSLNSLTDSTKNWDAGIFKGKYVRIVEGSGRGQIKKITNNTSNTLEIEGCFRNELDTTSQYEIIFYFNPKLSLWDVYFKLAIQSHAYNLKDSIQLEHWRSFISDGEFPTNKKKLFTKENYSVFLKFIEIGKYIFEWEDRFMIDLTNIKERIEKLENNEYSVTTFEIIDISFSATGSITLPTGATLHEDFLGPGNAVLSTYVAGTRPPIETPKNLNEEFITVNLDVNGNYVASDIYSGQVALIYQVKIKAIDYENLIEENIIDFYEDIHPNTNKHIERGVSIGDTEGVKTITHNLNSSTVDVVVTESSTGDKLGVFSKSINSNQITIQGFGSTKVVDVEIQG